jgi:fucose 4-O-acetylase-like acetyltransferase
MRDDRIDILRFIGLSMIVFAHVDPPSIPFQLRNFDVPLMILVSAMSFSLSYKLNEAYQSYIWKRIKRLVFPVWIFLTAYFAALFVINPSNSDLEIQTIITSYALLEGIGYVWVIRVFLLVALVSPIIFHWHRKTQSNKKYYLILAASFSLYEILRYLSLPYIWHGAGEIFSSVMLYIIPYSIIFALGLRMTQATKNQLSVMTISSLAIFSLIGAGLYVNNREFIPTQSLKYPPSIYYFSYALFISSLLWMHSATIDQFLEKIKVKTTVLFIASNSIWIYLWHIPLIKSIHTYFLLKYLIVYVVAVAITYAQISLINHWLARINNVSLKKNIKVLFTG